MISSFVVIDLETTGLSADKHHIIEVGAIKIRDGVIVDRYEQLLSPGYALPKEIVALTHITDEMLVGKPSFPEIAKELYEFLGEDSLLGHNVAFDYRFLKVNFARMQMPFEKTLIDTLWIAKEIHGDLESRSLGALCDYYRLTNKSAHRAIEDSKVTFLLYQKLRETMKNERSLDKSKIEKICEPKPYFFKVKKDAPITKRQKNYLLDLLKYHKIDTVQTVENLTKSQASRIIDKIILEYGRP